MIKGLSLACCQGITLTTLTFNTESGEIYDADMEINAVKGDVAITTGDTDVKTDLLSVLTHEATDVRQAVAGYYQGLQSVRDHGMYPSTKQYVANVMALRARF